MSKNLGITAVSDGIYYFISYNSDDEKRVSEIVKSLEQYGLPMWYDDGLKVGDAWEREIADRIQGCEAVILFLTDGIFRKESSYVQKEFVMATRFFNKRVYVIRLDDIKDESIPNKYLSFYIDLCNMQMINRGDFLDTHILCNRIMSDLGFEPNPDEYVEKLREKYDNLDDEQKLKLAGSFFEIWAAKRELAARARMIAGLYFSGSLKTDVDCITNGWNIGVGLSIYRLDVKTVYHTHIGYDAEILVVKRDGQPVFTVGGRFEPTPTFIFYDSGADVLYVTFSYYPQDEVKMELAAVGRGEDYAAQSKYAILTLENASRNPKGNIVEY